MSGSEDYFGEDLELDAVQFDAVVKAAATTPSIAGPATTTLRRTTSSTAPLTFTQKTLFGGDAAVKPTKTNNKTAQTHIPVPQQPRVTVKKTWDRLKFAESVPRTNGTAGKMKRKGKGRAGHGDVDDEHEDFVLDDERDLDGTEELMERAMKESAMRPPPPMKLMPELSEIKTWVYSTNKPKRKYQYDIVHKSLFTNCLVSLPTGLGKTFIAAVVMLNYYRWFPSGKILFLAPTRPLVQQQIEACHSIAGIPSSDCVALTGMIPAHRRATAWSTKRVVFSTPQTVENDLRRGRLDPQNVICVVIDEAHRATGNYAYCEVIRLMMQFNPHFRVLALTATPGNDAEKVQTVIDSLHIGHIEVRTEAALDIRPYTKTKTTDIRVVPLTAELQTIRDRWASLMKPLIDQAKHLIHGNCDPVYLAPFTLQQAQKSVAMSGQQHLRPTIALLSKMALAMSRLLEHSINSAGTKMRDLRTETSKVAKELCGKGVYKDLLMDIEMLQSSPTYTPHPKFDLLKSLVLEFFLEAKEAGKSPRLMVFCHFREVVEDIVVYLNQEGPLIKASSFVGQSKDNQGNLGMNQKQQALTIKKLKNDEINVLVATSIGEEGLDIGSLDCIICYDAQASPLRTLQRIGRTGRNEDGKVIVLMSQGREERNWDKAKERYEHVQNALVSGKMFELFSDCERLLPPGIRPICEEREIPVQEYIASLVEIEDGINAKSKPTKRQRDGVDDLPPNALKGFVTAKGVTGKKTREDSLAERAELALLSEEQNDWLQKQWARGVSLVNSNTPLDRRHAPILYHRTTTKLGRTNVASGFPSQTLQAVFTQSRKWSHDGNDYNLWQKSLTDALDRNLILQRTGQVDDSRRKKAYVPCTEIRDENRMRFQVPFKARMPDSTGVIGTAEANFEKLLFTSTSYAKHPSSDIFQRDAVDVDEVGILPPALMKPDSTRVTQPPKEDVVRKPSDPDNVLSSSDIESREIKNKFVEARFKPSSHHESLSNVVTRPQVKAPTARVLSAAPDNGTNTHSSKAPLVKGFSSSSFGDDDWEMSLGQLAQIDAIEANHPVEPKSITKSTRQVSDVTAKRLTSDRGADSFEEDEGFDSDGFAKPFPKSATKVQPIPVIDSDNNSITFVPTMVGVKPVDFDPTYHSTQLPIQRRRNVNRVKISSPNQIDSEVRPGKRKLRRGNEVEDEVGHSNINTGEEVNNKRVKTKKSGPKIRRGNDWAKKTGFFQLEASECSSESGNENGQSTRRRRRRHQRGGGEMLSSSPIASSENSIDREFVARSSSPLSPDTSNMTKFYRESLSTQHSAGKKFANRPVAPGQMRWKKPIAVQTRHVWIESPRRPDAGGLPTSEGSLAGFVVDDDQVEWDEGASGALQPGDRSILSDF